MAFIILAMHGERMEREILEQPARLAAVADRFASELGQALRGRGFEMVVLAARGSSDNAARYARYLIEVHLGIPVSLAAPSVITRHRGHIRYRNALAIGISQSGAAPDVAEVLEALRADGHFTVGITNTPGCRLAATAEFTLLLGVGDETSIAATKTYSATLLALYELTRALGGDLPASVTHLYGDEWLETCASAARETAGPVCRCSPVFCLGRGFGFSTAEEAALKLMECALIPAKAFSTADFHHGPKALAGVNSSIISFDGPQLDLAAQGAEIFEPPASPATAELKPLWDIPFGQYLALFAARNRGLDPDHARHLRKVTETL